jgi:class 3 adenylate cyclase
MRTMTARSPRFPGRASFGPRRTSRAAPRHRGGWRLARDAVRPPERALLSFLFTDIVGSTALAERCGDARWSALLARHHAIVRRQIACHGGTEVDDAGDGFFCTFASPTRAVRCAQAIRAAVQAIGIEIRAGVHAGECERCQGRVRGIAVHIGARIAAAAAPGEVRVSATVRDLVAGSDLAFADEALYSLPGLSKPCLLFRVAAAPDGALATPGVTTTHREPEAIAAVE